MGFVRTDIEDAKTPEDKKELEELFNRYLACDEWAIRAMPYHLIRKLESPESERYRKIRPPYNVAVLLTSHPGNRPYLKAAVESHRKLGFWITLAYDNYLDPERPEVTPNDVMPARDVLDQVDLFLMPHNQTWGGVMYPYFWLLKFGVAALCDWNFDFIYCANGDCVLEKPEGFPQLMEMLGDADIMGIGWEDNGGRQVFNGTGFLARATAIWDIMKHFEERFIPFETFEKYTNEIGNTEARFAKAILELELEHVKVKENPFNTQLHKKGGTWYDTIGFRHIHGEHSYAYKERLEPPEHKWFDERFTGDEYKRIKAYWETKDKKHLEDWWPNL
jgi:hypothetical protein